MAHLRKEVGSEFKISLLLHIQLNVLIARLTELTLGIFDLHSHLEELLFFLLLELLESHLLFELCRDLVVDFLDCLPKVLLLLLSAPMPLRRETRLPLLGRVLLLTISQDLPFWHLVLDSVLGSNIWRVLENLVFFV
mmetsp:Transcript_21992/g.21188  ORF Transcript_21992/g.21188 Transcript_21992/m.21188 type:complete len:137 (-) Transcript_21992:2336-2746(-)